MAMPEFPFEWKKHFVKEQNSEDCVPACVAMAAMYWNSKIKNLALPTKIEDWREYFDDLRVHSHRGTNIAQLKGALKKLRGNNSGVSLSLQVVNPQHLNDLTKLFEQKIPIPVILCYDRSMVINNFEGPNHASLFQSIDTWRDQVKVIDPSFIHRNDPMTYSTQDFLRGWNQVQNLTILAYPSNVSVPINMRAKDLSHRLDMYSDKK